MIYTNMEQVDHTRGSYYPTPGGLTDILGQWEMSTWSSCVLQIFSTPLNPSHSSASISSLSKTWSVPPSLSSEGHLISHISHNSRQEKGSGPLHFHHLLTLRLMERTLLLWDFTPSQTSLCPDLCHLPTFWSFSVLLHISGWHILWPFACHWTLFGSQNSQ